MPNLVLIDTCVWVPFFARKPSLHKTAVGRLLDDDRAAIIGPILAEVLLGFKRDEEADWVASAMEGIHILELDWDDWKAVARLGRELAARGHRLPLSDVALAAIALRHPCSLYSIDPHFDQIENLQRFDPSDKSA